jgi:hypothetical protein
MRYSKKTKENLEKFKRNIFKIILEYINDELDDLDLMYNLMQIPTWSKLTEEYEIEKDGMSKIYRKIIAEKFELIREKIDSIKDTGK